MSRLIDADALRESIITRQTEMSYEDAWALTCIDNAPTIEPDWTGLMVICDNCGHAIHVKRIDVKPTIEPQKWVSCSERLPEERDSIFSKLYGTEKWRDAMFRKISDTVICTVQFIDGTRQTCPCHTIDGEWNQSIKGMAKVLAWMPLPECYGGD